MKIKIYGCNKNKENCILIYKTKVKLHFYYFNTILINFKKFTNNKNKYFKYFAQLH